MHINYILIPFVIILGLLFIHNDNKQKRLFYILTCSVVLIFVAAMRSPEWLTNRYHIDTLNYKGYFESAIDMSWNDIKTALYDRYILNLSEYDVGFTALSKLFGLFTDDFFIFSILADLLFFVPFGIILYRFTTNNKQIIFAFVFYIALVQTYFLGGARQMFSIGFDMMALLAMIDKKRLLSVIFLLLGASVHMSSLLFAIPLILLWAGASSTLLKILHLLCLLVFPIALVYPNEFITFMGDAMGIERYSNYGSSVVQGGATTYIILIELLSLFCFIAIKRKNLIQNEKIRYFYVMAPLFTLFAPLIHSNGTMDRITLYFYLYIVLLLPYGIESSFKRKDKNIAYFVTIGALALLSLANGGLEYYFYWQR